MRLNALDLNLLLVLAALLEHESASKVAKLMGKSQSAISHSLNRLREALGDELFVRVGHKLEPTPRARELHHELQRTLKELEWLLWEPEAFVPAQTVRRFRIAANDYAQVSLLPELYRVIHERAPHAVLELVPLPALDAWGGILGRGALDVVVSVPAPRSPGLLGRRLYVDEMVCVMRAGHPALSEEWDCARYVAYEHVVVAPGASWEDGMLCQTAIDEVLAASHQKRRVKVQTSYFLAVPDLLQGADLIATLPGQLAASFCERAELVIVPCPVEVPGVSLHAVWHERVRRDPAILWLLGVLEGVAQTRRAPLSAFAS